MVDKRLTIGGVDWHYTTGGRGPKTILMFHGAVGGAETLQALADAFGDSFRTIAPTVAPVETLAEVCDAASAILDKEHVGHATVFGGSFGGMVAQAFLKRHRTQVDNLILLSTGAPGPLLGARTARMLKLVAWLPFVLTRAMTKAELSRNLNPPTTLDEEAARRVSTFRQRLDHYFDEELTKPVFMSRVRLSVDFNSRESYSPSDYDDWPGRILIVESDDDPMVNAEERARLRAMYPRALVCTFEGAGHMIPLLRGEELVGLVKAFINENYERPDFEEPCPTQS
jgi:pimeloyl-ACP methyl ester carboxylesterase